MEGWGEVNEFLESSRTAKEGMLTISLPTLNGTREHRRTPGKELRTKCVVA